MKAAARSAKARRKQREQGVRQVAISKEASDQLARQADAAGRSESNTLEKLIQQAFTRKARTNPRLKDIQTTPELEAALKFTHPAQPEQQIPRQANQQRLQRGSGHVRPTHPENTKNTDGDTIAQTQNEYSPTLTRIIEHTVTEGAHGDDASEITPEETLHAQSDLHCDVEEGNAFTPTETPTPQPDAESNADANPANGQEQPSAQPRHQTPKLASHPIGEPYWNGRPTSLYMQSIKAEAKHQHTEALRRGPSTSRKRGRKRK